MHVGKSSIRSSEDKERGDDQGGTRAWRGDLDLEAEVEVEEKRGRGTLQGASWGDTPPLPFLLLLPPLCVFNSGKDQLQRGSAAGFERRIRVSIYTLFVCDQNKLKSSGSLHVMIVDWMDMHIWNWWNFYCWSCWLQGLVLIFFGIWLYEWVEEVIPVRIDEKNSSFECLVQKLHGVGVSSFSLTLDCCSRWFGTTGWLFSPLDTCVV